MSSTASPTPADAGATHRWVPGEYAECMHDAPWYRRGLIQSATGPVLGDVAQVRSVLVERCSWNGKLVERLAFDRWPGKSYPSSAFRRAVKPKFTIRAISQAVKREPHFAGVGAAAIVTAFCYGAAAVAQLMGGDR